MKKYKLKITLTEPMLGTVPKDPEVYQSFIETKKPEGKKDPEFETVEKTEEKGWTGFHKDKKGLFIYDYMIRGFMKSAAKATKAETDLKAFKSKIDMWAFVFPRRIHIADESGSYIQKPDGKLERPLRAETAKGPRVTVAKSDTINEGRVIECELHVLNTAELTDKRLRTIFNYGMYSGLGQFRNGSYGRFEYELKEIKQK